MIIFPEGTRSRDGAMRSFTRGGFELATAGTPVLGIALSGTGDALPRRGVLLQGRHPITLPVLPPISPEGLDPAELAVAA